MDQTDRFFAVLPPEVSGEHQVLSDTTSTSATNYDWVAALSTSAPKGTCYLYVEALTQDVYVRFKASGAAGTTSTNGVCIKAGQSRTFWVDPILHNVVDHLGAGAGKIKLQVVSKIGARRYV